MPRALPPNPDLDQLRYQAKDLLKASRSRDMQALLRIEQVLPDRSGAARLADAQLVIAREYGFASWPKLKHHVEAIVAQQAVVLAQPTIKLLRETPYRLRITQLANRIIASAAEGAIQEVLAALIIPARDILALRAHLVETGGYTPLVDALLKGVEHPHPRTRFLAAQAMDHFADARCAAPLRVLLRDPVPRVRWAALHSLTCEECKLAPIATSDDLVELVIELAMNDPSIRVRRVAAYTLGGDCYDRRAVAALQTLLAREMDAAILRGARSALARQLLLATRDDKMTG
ncbi:MAG TPA: HEAT repeat domain-containing protein [Roseiflexaceae bacterium]|nr:HEAT repeat domain-containing protein [Roseiflexaceae bacterium]